MARARIDVPGSPDQARDPELAWPPSNTSTSITPGALSRHASSAICQSTPLIAMQQYFLLQPEDSVYSYFMFMPPIDQRRTKRYITPLTVFAAVLVVVNFAMQTGLLLVVGRHIQRKHTDWVSNIAHIKNFAWYHVVPMPYNLPPPKCRGEQTTACWDHGDGLSCGPPSVRVLSDFGLLDSDGDGVWSRSEAEDEQLREAAQCDYGIDLPYLYERTVQQINASVALAGRRNAELIGGDGIHKAYFNFYLHKPLLCQYGDSDMCGVLFKRGFFDEALRQQPFADFADTASALQYCNRVLRSECFDMLPNTYRVWRSVSNQQCGEKTYGQTLFQNPRQDDSSGTAFSTFPMLTVDFGMVEMYRSTESLFFRVFLFILLLCFLSVMFLEIRSISKSLFWVFFFPKDLDAGRNGQIVGRRAVRIVADKEGGFESDTEDFSSNVRVVSKSISAVRTDHRCAVFVVTVLRLFLWVFLLWSGIMFLTMQPKYLTLIFDALSLVFIFEIDELLFKTMLRHEFKVDHLTTEDVRVPTAHGGLISGKHSVVGEILWFLGIIVFAMSIVYTYCRVELSTLIDALGCFCSVEGSHCHEAQHFSKRWWDTYWSSTMPAANIVIDTLKGA